MANQGIYHPTYNPNGSKKASDGNFWYNTAVSFNSISDCFDPAKLLTASGYIGSVSGRPDELFYDQVHESDILDLRNSSKKVEDYNRLISREFNKLVAGSNRGKDGEKLFKPITFTNCGFVQYGTPTGTLKPYRIGSSSSFMPKWHSYWGSSAYGIINQLFGGVVPTIPFAIILAKKDGTNYFIEVSPSSSYTDLVVFRTLDGTPTLPNVGNLVELVFDEITWLWLPSAYDYMGTYYGHKNSIISTRTKSNTLLHCDIIGNPTNYPTAWKQSGVFGTPLIVAEDSASLLPDGIKDTFKLSRKANATPLLCLRSTDSGATWTSFTSTFSTTTNEITLTNEPAGNLVMVFYQTHTSMAVPVTNSEVIEYGKALGTDGIANAHLISTLIGKVSTANTAPYLQMGYDINAYRIDASTLKFSTTATEIPTHSALSLAGGAVGVPAVKVLPYLTRLNRKAYLNLVFKEMKHNGTSWGDSNKFEIVDNVSTTTDLNAQTVLIGQKTVELPYFIAGDE